MTASGSKLLSELMESDEDIGLRFGLRAHEEKIRYGVGMDVVQDLRWARVTDQWRNRSPEHRDKGSRMGTSVYMIEMLTKMRRMANIDRLLCRLVVEQTLVELSPRLCDIAYLGMTSRK